MAKVERFQDLRVWAAARELVKAVYEATASRGLSKDYALRDQMRRAAISVPSNIAEGFARRSNREFVQFLFIAKGSAAELQSQLYTALDLAYLDQDGFDRLSEDTEVLSKQLSRLISYLRTRAA